MPVYTSLLDNACIMGLKALLITVHEALSRSGLDHALIGGMGLAALGVHRATHDVDFLVPGEKREELKRVLTEAGWQLVFETKEVLHFDGLGKVDFLLANRPLSSQMLVEAEPRGSMNLKTVSPEGIIGLKIQAYKNDPRRELQDKADIEALIRKYPSLKWDEVRTYAELFGEWRFIEGLRDRG